MQLKWTEKKPCLCVALQVIPDIVLPKCTAGSGTQSNNSNKNKQKHKNDNSNKKLAPSSFEEIEAPIVFWGIIRGQKYIPRKFDSQAGVN